MKRLPALLRRLCILLVCLPSSVAVGLAEDIITTYAGDASLTLNHPLGIAADGAGNVYIADSVNRRILRVTGDGAISTFANGGLMRIPTSVALDAGGNVIVAETFEIGNRVFLDTFTNTVLKITPDGTMSRLGSTRQWYFFDYEDLAVDGEECVAGVAIDADGNVFVAETISHSVWKITPVGNVILVAGTGTSPGFSGDNGPATSASLSYPNGMAVDAGGNLFVADSYNNRIRKITPEGIITTVAGNGTRGFSGDGGAATSAQLSYPLGVAVDAHGNLFIADSSNNRIRRVTPEGIITTIAGNGIPGFGGDGGPPTLAQLHYPTAVAVDGTGNVFIADLYNNRIRKVVTTLTAPTVAGVSPTLGARGATLDVTLSGTSFASPLTIDAGAGITVTDIVVTSSTRARARLTIAPDATLGPRELAVGTELGTIQTPFTVVSPFPDLRVTTSPGGNLGVGFDGSFSIGVSNVGSTPTTGPVTFSDVLPLGLSFVSGSGYGWSCSAKDQTVSCTYSKVLASGASTTLRLTVAVASTSASVVTHTVSVSTDGDLDSTSNAASDVATIVATPAPKFQFSRSVLVPGQQETVAIALPVVFPFPVSGTLTLSFSPNVAISVDDPAIQFSTGGRTVTFTIPANSLQTRFATASDVGPIGFQAGTVAGTLTFSGTLQAGTVETTFSSSMTIPQSAPALRTVQTLTQEGFAALITSLSTMREVTQLNLAFNTTPAVRLSCGTVTGCSVTGQTLSLDVRSQFDQWFAADTSFGSLSTLRVPLSIDGIVHGTVLVTLRNSRGTSNAISFTLP